MRRRRIPTSRITRKRRCNTPIRSNVNPQGTLPMKRLMQLAALILPLLTVACNTMQGVGEDVQAGGKALENSADKNKDY